MGARGRLDDLRELGSFRDLALTWVQVAVRRGPWPSRWPSLFRVSGHSMTPTLNPGDWVLTNPVNSESPQPGELVVIRSPEDARRTLVKRVRSIGARTFSVGSDNPLDGRDSRHFGPVRPEHFLGRVIAVWRAR